MTKEFTPFGKKWEKEIMRWKKIDIINLLRTVINEGKEADEINKAHNWKMFKIFAKLHPVEAYDHEPDDFCKFMREEGNNMTNKQVKEFIDSNR
jgi:hypothetical protein